jgi:hypothetical protein
MTDKSSSGLSTEALPFLTLPTLVFYSKICAKLPLMRSDTISTLLKKMYLVEPLYSVRRMYCVRWICICMELILYILLKSVLLLISQPGKSIKIRIFLRLKLLDSSYGPVRFVFFFPLSFIPGWIACPVGSGYVSLHS